MAGILWRTVGKNIGLARWDFWRPEKRDLFCNILTNGAVLVSGMDGASPQGVGSGRAGLAGGCRRANRLKARWVMWYSGFLWPSSNLSMTRETIYLLISGLLGFSLIWVYYVLVKVARNPTKGFKWRLRILLGLFLIPSIYEAVGINVPAITQSLNFAKIIVLLGVFLFCVATGLAFLGFQLARLVRWIGSRRQAPAAG
ncbi:MAG TPA: hypothetical protein VL860_02215, partial [Planctomycetota bacterium]|nr:hypothetical protein [Planctomycetota bacterium]